MKRRLFLAGLLGTASLPLIRATHSANEEPSSTKIEKIRRSEAEWRKVLTPEQFDVLRDEGTERAGSSPLNDEKRAGEYRCAGCDLALFTSLPPSRPPHRSSGTECASTRPPSACSRSHR